MLASCEEVIDIELNSANPTLVIEATLENNEFCNAYLTKTGDYFDNETAKVADQATITLKDDKGHSEILSHVGNGFYQGNTIVGVPGNVYTMTINEGETTYTSVSAMPPITDLDAVTFTPTTGAGFGHGPGTGGKDPDVSYVVLSHFKDDVNATNYYRIKHIENGNLLTKIGQYMILNDNLINGNDIEIGLFHTTFDVGDTVTVELISYDKDVYEYFNTFVDVMNTRQGNSSTPFNPTSNFDNGAMGYFGALAISRTTVIIK